MQSRLRHSAGLGGMLGSHGSQSWSSYWTSSSKVLFFGEVSKIRDGKLYNQKSGATDYLTVTGTAGSYTFECPDTNAYKTADEDRLWATSGGVINTVTEEELIELDYYRTLVKFDNTTPNELRAIAILNSGVILTEEDINRLHRDFSLWLYWSDSLNINGFIKDNREISSQPEVVSAQITQAEPTKVAITFDQNLNETQIPDVSAFTLTGKTITNVDISGTIVTLTVSVSYDYGDVVTVDYTRPVVDPLIGAIVGRRTDSFTDQVVTNNISYINLLADGNTFGFYDSLNADSFTYSSGVSISKWADSLGSGNDLTEGTRQPTKTSNGVSFSIGTGSNQQRLRIVTTLNQPTFIYMVFRYKHWGPSAAGEFILGGGAYTNFKMEYGDTEPMLRVTAGANSPPNSDLLKNAWGIARILYNGAVASSFQINTGVKWTGNLFTQNPGGITINGRATDGNGGSDLDVLGLVVRKVADNDTTSGLIYDFLMTKYSSWLT